MLTLNKVYLILTRTYYIISIGKNRKDAIETKKGTLQRSFFFMLCYCLLFLSSHLQIRWQITPAMIEVKIVKIAPIETHLLYLLNGGAIASAL